MTTLTDLPFVVGPGEGIDAPLAKLGTIHKVPSGATRGRVAIVEHTLAARSLATPLHRHTREDELSIVLEGTMGAMLGDDVVIAEAGAYVLKPSHQWHAFWNAGDTPLRFIELLLPGGFEDYFARLSPMLRRAGDQPNPAAIESLAAEFGIEFDFESVPTLCERFGLTFG